MPSETLTEKLRKGILAILPGAATHSMKPIIAERLITALLPMIREHAAEVAMEADESAFDNRYEKFLRQAIVTDLKEMR